MTVHEFRNANKATKAVLRKLIFIRHLCHCGHIVQDPLTAAQPFESPSQLAQSFESARSAI